MGEGKVAAAGGVASFAQALRPCPGRERRERRPALWPATQLHCGLRAGRRCWMRIGRSSGSKQHDRL